MKCKQLMVLEAIFSDPIPGDVPCAVFDEMLWVLDCLPLGGSPGRMRFVRRGLVLTLQLVPPWMLAHQVRDVRDFLRKTGLDWPMTRELRLEEAEYS